MGDDSYTSRIDFDNEKFYKMLDDFDGIPVTSQITAFEYQETFEKLYSEGYTDVINTTINSKGSATYNNAVMAAEEFYSAHPESKGKFTKNIPRIHTLFCDQISNPVCQYSGLS